MGIYQEKRILQFGVLDVLETVAMRKKLDLSTLCERLRNDAVHLMEMHNILVPQKISILSDNQSLLYSLYESKTPLRVKIETLLHAAHQQGLSYELFTKEWNKLTYSELQQNNIYEASTLALFTQEIDDRISAYQDIATIIDERTD